MWINEHTDGRVVIGSAPGPAPAGLPALLNGFRRAGLTLLPAEKHLGIRVSDAEQAERELLALGATRVSGERETGFRVLTDPVGHPFCIIFGHDSQCPGGIPAGCSARAAPGPAADVGIPYVSAMPLRLSSALGLAYDRRDGKVRNRGLRQCPSSELSDTAWSR
jgi:hypothetical protein